MTQSRLGQGQVLQTDLIFGRKHVGTVIVAGGQGEVQLVIAGSVNTRYIFDWQTFGRTALKREAHTRYYYDQNHSDETSSVESYRFVVNGAGDGVCPRFPEADVVGPFDGGKTLYLCLTKSESGEE